MTTEHENRNLTEDDAELIAEKLLEKMEAKFYKDLGKGLWGLLSKLLLAAAVALAAYGAATGGRFSWPPNTP